MFLTGDMNERKDKFLAQIDPSLLHPAPGPKDRVIIDWILATPDVRFKGWAIIRDEETEAISDHPLVYTLATTE